MNRKSGMIALLVAMAASSAAAELPTTGDRCAIAETSMRRYIRVLQSCSDAMFVRGDIDEAKALCRAGELQSEGVPDLVMTLLRENNDPTSNTARQGCVRARIRPLTPAFMATMRWGSDFMRLQLYGEGKDTFGPLVVHPPAP